MRTPQIANTTGTKNSWYYVKSGPLCISFPITDPSSAADVGVMRADWMQNCDKAGLAKSDLHSAVWSWGVWSRAFSPPSFQRMVVISDYLQSERRQVSIRKRSEEFGMGTSLKSLWRICPELFPRRYVGREMVNGDWADHYSCAVEDQERNMTIAFQNWHSLGLGSTAKGLPLRVRETADNSMPRLFEAIMYRNIV